MPKRKVPAPKFDTHRIRFDGPAKRMKVVTPSGAHRVFEKGQEYVIEEDVDLAWVEAVTDGMHRFAFVMPSGPLEVTEASPEPVTEVVDSEVESPVSFTVDPLENAD